MASAFPRSPRRGVAPPDETPLEEEMEPESTDVSWVKDQSTSAWKANLITTAHKEETSRMATPTPEVTQPQTATNHDISIEDFHSARDLLGVQDGQKRSIFEPDPTQFELVASDINAIVDAMIHSGDAINRINDTVSERIMTFTEKMIQDSTDGAYKDLVRLQHYGTVIAMAARGYLLAETLASLTLHKLQDLGADSSQLPKLPLQDFLYALQTLTMQRLKPSQGSSLPGSASEVMNR